MVLYCTGLTLNCSRLCVVAQNYTTCPSVRFGVGYGAMKNRFVAVGGLMKLRTHN